jgi:hypothetical protein
MAGSSSGGTGFCGMLVILFIGLKLCGVIDWHWGWVISQLLLPLSVVIIFGIVVVSTQK